MTLQHDSADSAQVHPTATIGAARAAPHPPRRAEGGWPSREGPPPPPPGGRPPKTARLAPASVPDTARRPPGPPAQAREPNSPAPKGAGTGRAGPWGGRRPGAGRPRAARTEAIVTAAKQGATPVEIAAALGLPLAHVRDVFKRHALGAGQQPTLITVSVGARAATELAQAAAARGWSVADLAGALLTVIGRDEMVDAVLDDADAGARPA